MECRVTRLLATKVEITTESWRWQGRWSEDEGVIDQWYLASDNWGISLTTQLRPANSILLHGFGQAEMTWNCWHGNAPASTPVKTVEGNGKEGRGMGLMEGDGNGWN